MNTATVQQDIHKILGLESLSGEEQAVFLADVGELIIESALLRLVADMSPDQEASINHYLETNPEPQVFMEHLLKHHASFATILEEEVTAFKEECIAVMGRGAMKEAAVAQAVN